jgi:hypothetical protein
MEKSDKSGQYSPQEQRIRFRQFNIAFHCALERIREESTDASDNTDLLFDLVREAVDKGLIPDLYIDEFNRVIAHHDARGVTALMNQLAGYYDAVVWK